MTEHCRVSKYYPLTAYMQEGVRYIARLDGKNPVTVLNEVDNYTSKYVFQKALNLFEIIELYKKTVPEHEDWFVAYQSGFDFTEDVRNRNPRKYTKRMVYEMMLRLAHHRAFKCFSTRDIIKEGLDLGLSSQTLMVGNGEAMGLILQSGNQSEGLRMGVHWNLLIMEI